MKTQTQSLAEQLATQIADIERKIADLQRERQVHQRILARTLAHDAAQTQVSRRNSVTRILAEKVILDLLNSAPDKIFSSNKISEAVRLFDPSIKPVTLRSYLHRLKARGEIRPSVSRRGYWSSVTKTPNSS